MYIEKIRTVKNAIIKFFFTMKGMGKEECNNESHIGQLENK